MTENESIKIKNVQKLVKFPYLALLISLIIMLVFDQITWERRFGIQFLLLMFLILIGLFVLVWAEKKSIPWTSYLLMIPILFGAIMTIIQKATTTTFLNIMLALLALAYLAITLLNGHWMRYRIREVGLGFLLLVKSALVDPIKAFLQNSRFHKENASGEKKNGWQKIRPFLLGLLIAIPLILILTALLASADLIFRERLAGLLNLITIDNIIEYIFRLFYIIILGYFLMGAYLHALTRSADEKSFTPDKPVVQPFLGFVEALTVLVLVNLLFLSFIIIQFRYFFAGQANISVEGFTFAEYARRGFFELVAVAVISLGVFYLLSMFTKRNTRFSRISFSALSALLLVQVGCMLISAYQRLNLYEAAYGFTTFRTITHIFMFWLGILLIVVMLMEVFNRFRRLALVLFLGFFGFTVTLNLLNMDRFIVQRNLAHAIAGHPLDAGYLLNNLSADSIPALFEAEQAPETPQELKDTLTAILACKFARKNAEENSERSWMEWHYSESKANRLFEKHRDSLEEYRFNLHSETYYYDQDGRRFEDFYGYYYFEAGGEEIYCMPAE